jgi:hypothetical protein
MPILDGSCDLTAHVAFDSLVDRAVGRRRAGATTHAAGGAHQLGLSDSRAVADASRSRGYLPSWRMPASGQLLDPAGLGGLAGSRSAFLSDQGRHVGSSWRSSAIIIGQ